MQDVKTKSYTIIKFSEEKFITCDNRLSSHLQTFLCAIFQSPFELCEGSICCIPSGIDGGLSNYGGLSRISGLIHNGGILPRPSMSMTLSLLALASERHVIIKSKLHAQIANLTPGRLTSIHHTIRDTRIEMHKNGWSYIHFE
ncbi:hypothetical protein CDAR_433391 [Caerostris darwini]|uniref:Uncharacterized protein n=1 Tax=Caerostris darwini TaxID=1538125 RepID=A0AAV4WDG3_9ARAC|nr:hypothetical protein CDAR_433391 [Caerostris darwini]